jgi:peptidyl-tRNA hydrolase, PTH1 family
MAALRRATPSSRRRGTPADLLVVGLGNPGEQYAQTRHNVGARTVDRLVERHGGRLRLSKEQALTDELRLDDKRVAVAFPTTYMNESGRSVQLLIRRYGIDDLSRLVVVQDELDLEPGRVKVKLGGGLAGHNGLRSIRSHLGSTDFVRVRIGVGKPVSKESGADHVLRRVGKAEQAALDVAIELAADAVETIAAEGVDVAMHQINGST